AGDEDLGRFGSEAASSGMTSYALGLTPGFLADVLEGDRVSLRLYGADSDVSAVFNSRSFGTPGNRPLLTIVAVPEPGPMALSALGALCLSAVRVVYKRKA